MNLLLILALLFAVRLASVFVVQTFYVPDEYWQSLEVAHKLTFGYGHLTWEWVQGIRSYIYPLVIAGVYKLLAILNLDSVRLLILLPRILQACLSAYADYRFFVWAGRRKWALFIVLIPWFSFYIGSRTLANTLEASLTTISLSYFPWRGEGSGYLWPAALTCNLRPTAVIIWIPLFVYHMRKTLRVKSLLLRALFVGSFVLGCGVACDSYLHGKLIVTPYEFLKFNLIENIGSFYGTHPWHWYFTVGLPTVLGINTIPFIFGVVETIRKRDTMKERYCLLWTVLVSLAALSLVEHKEFRFVASLLPMCLYIIADTMSRWSYRASSGLLWFAAIVIVVGNFIPAWYLSTIHQRGPNEVMTQLQGIATGYKSEADRRASVLFLMPCHSTPYYSHVHENITMRFLTCEPNLQKLPDYKDEADRFYDSPARWLRANVPAHPRTAMPTHVVLFEPLAMDINEFLTNYKLLHRVGHSEVKPSDPALNTHHHHPILHLLPDAFALYFRDLQHEVQTILQQTQRRTGKNVLVYQRLRVGEENTFNREEYAEEAPAEAPQAVGEDLFEEESHSGDSQNLFN